MYFYFVIKYLVLRITLINLDRPSRSRWGADTCWINHAMSLCMWGRLQLGLGFFIISFIVRHMAAQQLLDLVANAIVGPCFRVRVFHRIVYSAPHGSTTTVRFSCKCNCWPMF